MISSYGLGCIAVMFLVSAIVIFINRYFWCALKNRCLYLRFVINSDISEWWRPNTRPNVFQVIFHVVGRHTLPIIPVHFSTWSAPAACETKTMHIILLYCFLLFGAVIRRPIFSGELWVQLHWYCSGLLLSIRWSSSLRRSPMIFSARMEVVNTSLNQRAAIVTQEDLCHIPCLQQ